MTISELRSFIYDVPDFPKVGVTFKDITPLLARPEAFSRTIDLLTERLETFAVNEILAIESRGFIFGAAVSQRLSLPLQLVRKPGKLPRPSIHASYELEYGFDRLEIHSDVIQKDRRYAIVDDLLATGGTAAAAAELVDSNGGAVACCAFVIELAFLNGRQRLAGHVVDSLIRYD